MRPCLGSLRSSTLRPLNGNAAAASALQGLQRLNAVGYGRPGSGLELDLVYNPNGAFLAPSQASLEGAYRWLTSEPLAAILAPLTAGRSPLRLF